MVKTDNTGFGVLFAQFFRLNRTEYRVNSNDVVTRALLPNGTPRIDAVTNQYGRPGNHLVGITPCLNLQMVQLAGGYKEPSGPNVAGLDNPNYITAQAAELFKKRRQL
jgi:hypothetical protein